MLAAIETGGTKIIARVVGGDGQTIDETRWPTGTGAEAVAALTTFLSPHALAGVGIAAFGPIVVSPAEPRYGEVLETTKPGWTGTNLVGALAARMRCPVAIDTDVNAAAIAEQAAGAGQGLDPVAYVTVGTGIGGGLAIGGASLKGALHPEIGHLPVVRRGGDTIASRCLFHDSCAEGLAAGPTFQARRAAGWSEAGATQVTADYLGQLLAQLVLAWSPAAIVLGGGVLGAPGLFEQLPAALARHLGQYGLGDACRRPDFLRRAALPDAGLHGALLLARRLAS